MATNRLGFALVGIACIVAAGGGSYIATRQNLGEVAVPAAVASAPAPSAAPETAAAATPAAAVEPPAMSASAEPVEAEQRPAPVTATQRRPRPVTASAPRRAAARPVPQVVNDSPQNSASAPALAATSQAPAVEPPSVLPEEIPAVPVEQTPVEPVATIVEASPSRAAREVVVTADSVIGLRTEGLLTSERARVEDRVEARVVRDVRVNGLVAIPAGTRALGTVVVVERGGKVRERARLGIKFDRLVLDDGTELAIATEPIYRMGESPANGSRARIGGGAVAGAILGAIIAGGKGAAIGATTGAGAGTAAVMTGERSAAAFPPGSEVTARILAPIAVSVEHREQ